MGLISTGFDALASLYFYYHAATDFSPQPRLSSLCSLDDSRQYLLYTTMPLLYKVA